MTIIEPSGFTTDWAGSSAVRATPNPVYDFLRGGGSPSERSGAKRGDPKATTEAILKVVDAENPPLRLLLGTFAAEHVKEVYPKRLAIWAEWEAVSRAANGT